MKNHMTETEMKNLANANTQYFVDDYGKILKGPKVRKNFGIFLGKNKC